MAYGWDILAAVNLNRIFQEQTNQLSPDINRSLTWTPRAKVTDATEDELTAYTDDHVFIADVVSEDSRALIRDAGSFRFEQHKIAKIKHGFGLSGSQIKMLHRIERAAKTGSFVGDNELLGYKSYVMRRTGDLLWGVKQRAETMILGALLGGYNYDRLGIKMQGNFNMPADLKVNPAIEWSDINATPIADMVAVINYALTNYGETYNRISMSYDCLGKITKTKEFKALYNDSGLFNFQPSSVTVDLRSATPQFFLPFLANVVSALLAKDSTGNAGTGRAVVFELNEDRYREHNATGVINTPERFHPIEKVLFTNSADDNSSGGWDWGNGELIEAVLGSLPGTNMIGSFEGVQPYGPLAYATQADPTLAAPGIVVWAAQEGGGRRIRKSCSALINAFTPAP